MAKNLTYRSWTALEDAALIEASAKKRLDRFIAKDLGRTVCSIQDRRKDLGIVKYAKDPNAWRTARRECRICNGQFGPKEGEEKFNFDERVTCSRECKLVRLRQICAENQRNPQRHVRRPKPPPEEPKYTFEDSEEAIRDFGSPGRIYRQIREQDIIGSVLPGNRVRPLHQGQKARNLAVDI